MSDKPVLSVVIPAHNAEKTLKECLDSVSRQTFEDYEIIVVDNDSTDRTRSIIRQAEKKDGRIVYLFEPLKGRGAARNTGIEKARGEIIVTTDADCVAPPDWLDMLTYPIRRENEAACMGSERDLIMNYWTRNMQNANRRFLERNSRDKYISHIDTKNFAIRSALMKKLMFDPALGNFEDLDLYLRLKKVAKIRFVPEVTVGHNHKSSFNEVMKINYNRGYWTARIYKKHNDVGLRNEPMLESLSILNLLSFPFWMILQFFKRPPGESFFILVSELSWRLGLLSSLLKR